MSSQSSFSSKKNVNGALALETGKLVDTKCHHPSKLDAFYEYGSNLTGIGATMHIDEALKALQFNDNNGATMHTQEAQKNL